MMNEVTCPLCAAPFAPRSCPPACPMARGCPMVRCPRCGYEFVTESKIVAYLRSLLSRSRGEARQ